MTAVNSSSVKVRPMASKPARRMIRSVIPPILILLNAPGASHTIPNALAMARRPAPPVLMRVPSMSKR